MANEKRISSSKIIKYVAVTKDMENFVEYKLMGTVKKVITKENCEPWKF